jgi:hypothetical protein
MIGSMDSVEGGGPGIGSIILDDWPGWEVVPYLSRPLAMRGATYPAKSYHDMLPMQLEGIPVEIAAANRP